MGEIRQRARRTSRKTAAGSQHEGNQKRVKSSNDSRSCPALRAVHGSVVVCLVVLALALCRGRSRDLVPRGLLAGGIATLGVAALAVPFVLLGFDRFFTRFHELFFEGDSWRFSTRDTLIRLYPEQLWRDVSILAAVLTVCQAVVVALVARWWLRRACRATR